MFPCPCHSKKIYAQCCEPYHLGVALPPTAVELMRSRYSAYAMGNDEYILQTLHPDHTDHSTPLEQRRKQIKNFSNKMKFVGLQIVSFEPGLPYSYVTFRAELFSGDKDASFTERSEFGQVGGRWLYRRRC